VSRAEQLGNTWPPSALAVAYAIRDNRKAYEHVRDTGRIDFKARLISIPSGAHVFYKKLIDTEYLDYSSQTDVMDASFELATWLFKFHIDGCEDLVDRISPYNDVEPVKIEVKFTKCRGKR
jgi:hypothetical protein